MTASDYFFCPFLSHRIKWDSDSPLNFRLVVLIFITFSNSVRDRHLFISDHLQVMTCLFYWQLIIFCVWYINFFKRLIDFVIIFLLCLGVNAIWRGSSVSQSFWRALHCRRLPSFLGGTTGLHHRLRSQEESWGMANSSKNIFFVILLLRNKRSNICYVSFFV